MASQRPLPVESLLPFPDRSTAPQAPTDAQEEIVDTSGIYDQSPESAEDEDHSANDAEKPKRRKRARACIACRTMKIRCLPVEGQDACNGCAKVHRECIMPGPPRKRQKTVHKVAELEKKINALTDALLAKGQQSDSTPTESPENQLTTSSTSEPAKTDATSVDDSRTMAAHYERNFIGQAFPSSATPDYSGLNCVPAHVEALVKDNYVDVIDRGDLSLEDATSLYKYWRQVMCASSCSVVFPPGTDMQDVRTRRPILFLTILTVSSPVLKPSAQPALTIELNRILSERVLFHGEKSMDLVQALTLNSAYYMRPRTARDLAFNQNIHAAAVMSLELGLGKRSSTERAGSPLEALENRRTWLACYQQTSTVAVLLRLPTLLRYSTHIEECLQYVQSSPYAQPSDKWLCALVHVQRIFEEASIVFEMDDPEGKVNFLEPKIQYQLKIFERQLKTWQQQTDAPVEKALVEHMVAVATIYTHEIAMHVEHNIDDFRPGPMSMTTKSTKPLDFVTSAHVDALLTILAACHKALDIYVSFELGFARSVPNLFIVWSTYAMVVLVKLHWIVHAPDSKFGPVFLADVKTEYYLDAMMKQLAAVADGGHGPCAEAFGFVYQKLKMWHMHRSGRFSDEERKGGSQEQHLREATKILSGTPVNIFKSTKKDGLPVMGANPQETPRPEGLPATPAYYGQTEKMNQFGSDLNAAYDAASYGNTNWDQFNFSVEELNMFDAYMSNASGWMGYLM